MWPSGSDALTQPGRKSSVHGISMNSQICDDFICLVARMPEIFVSRFMCILKLKI
jgi:hypothetical protein